MALDEKSLHCWLPPRDRFARQFLAPKLSLKENNRYRNFVNIQSNLLFEQTSICRSPTWVPEIISLSLQLFREERLSEKMSTLQSRKLLWDMINTLFLTLYCSFRTYFCCFPLALANIRPWPLVPFFQISLKNSELKTTHNTFRDCLAHFFRQLFSK